jgi:hypothetical protein
MIVTAINNAAQVGAYQLSPAMRNRFGWFSVETSPKQWVAWALSKLEEMKSGTTEEMANRYEDIKLFLTELLTTQFCFSSYEEFLNDDDMLFTTPRSMWNLLTFADFELPAIMAYAQYFVSLPAETAIRTISQSAIRNRSNAVLEKYRRGIENLKEFHGILETADSVKDVTVLDEQNRSVPF